MNRHIKDEIYGQQYRALVKRIFFSKTISNQTKAQTHENPQRQVQDIDLPRLFILQQSSQENRRDRETSRGGGREGGREREERTEGREENDNDFGL